MKDKYTFCVFISPSGNGLKVLVKIPNDAENHIKYFQSLENYYNSNHFDTQVETSVGFVMNLMTPLYMLTTSLLYGKQ